MQPKWLEWGKALQALSQNGLTYSQNVFDIERYEAIQKIAAEIMATYAQIDTQPVLTLFDQQVGHATPKVDVRGAVFVNDQILLVRERADGLWTLPGGWADTNEAPSEAVEREVWEESGYHTRAKKILAVYDRNKHGHPPYPFHAYKLFILCELESGHPIINHEISEVGFFDEHQLPPLSLTRVVPEQIQRCYEHHRNPELSTDFD